MARSAASGTIIHLIPSRHGQFLDGDIRSIDRFPVLGGNSVVPKYDSQGYINRQPVPLPLEHAGDCVAAVNPALTV
jgi:hypothetical protein